MDYVLLFPPLTYLDANLLRCGYGVRKCQFAVRRLIFAVGANRRQNGEKLHLYQPRYIFMFGVGGV